MRDFDRIARRLIAASGKVFLPRLHGRPVNDSAQLAGVTGNAQADPNTDMVCPRSACHTLQIPGAALQNDKKRLPLRVIVLPSSFCHFPGLLC